MRKLIAALMSCGVAVAVATQVYAFCGSSLFMIHQGSAFQCKDATEVAAFAYMVNDPRNVNIGKENIACEATGGQCLTGGTFDDGQFTIETDWGNPTVVGCPEVTGSRQRVMIVVQANDGRGILASLSGAGPELFGGYVVEAAHDNDLSPIVCGNDAGRPTINSATNNADNTTTLDLSFPTALRVHHDCEPTSFGANNGTCNDSFVPNAQVGRIYSATQRCGTRPDINTNAVCSNFPKFCTVGGTECNTPSPAGTCIPSAWTLRTEVPDATGRASVRVPRPTTTGDCTFVGATTNIAGIESGAITGFASVGGPGAASPVALGVRAEQAAGSIRVHWRTDVELGLAGFNVLTEGKKGTQKVSDTMIPAKGNGGGATYEASIPRGKFQGSRTVIIESVLTDGTTLKSAPAKF